MKVLLDSATQQNKLNTESADNKTASKQDLLTNPFKVQISWKKNGFATQNFKGLKIYLWTMRIVFINIW
jgi:hypothetical protein